MSQPDRFCPECGFAVALDENFCSACGARQAPPAGPGAASSSGAERIVGVVPQVCEIKGFLGKNTTFLNVVATSTRIILANQPDDMWDAMDAEEKQMQAAYSPRDSTWRTFIASYAFEARPWLVYMTMDADRILAENPGNTAIPLSEIEAAEITLSEDRDPELCGSTLILTTRSGPREMELTWGNGEEAHRVLSRVMAVTMRMKED